MNGYSLQNIWIQGKKVEIVKLDNHVIDQQDVTIVWPIKLVEHAQICRENKLAKYFQRTSNKQAYNFTWTSQTQPIQQLPKNQNKRADPQWSQLFKCNPSTPVHTVQRQRSSYKLNTSYGERVFRDNNNKSSRDSLKKFQLIDIMKSKELLNKSKIQTKPNHSGVYASAKNGKQNAGKEDVYGLENLQQPKIKTKTLKSPQGGTLF